MSIGTIPTNEKDPYKQNNIIRQLVVGLNSVASNVSSNLVGGQLPATSTNDNANAGKLGQFLVASVAAASPLSILSGAFAPVASLAVTAGDWDIRTNGFVTLNPATVLTEVLFGASVSSVAFDGTLDRIGIPAIPSPGFTGLGLAGQMNIPAGPSRISVSNTTSVYLLALLAFTVSAASVYGVISARRVR